MVHARRVEDSTLEIEFSAEDVARTRFAVSPLWEVVASVRVLKGADPQGMHRRWAEQVRPLLAAAKLDLTPLSRLIPVPTTGIPGFLVPPPTTPQPSLEVELAALRATPPDLLRTKTPEARAGVDALREDPERGLARLAELIAAYWEVALAPYWPRLLTLYEGDILHRARRIAEGGARHLFHDLDPQVTWDSGTLQLTDRRCNRGVRRLTGQGLLLCPSAFVWPRIFSTLGSPDAQPTLRYPPRGVGTLWEQRPQPCSSALARVLGRTRAILLAELAAPATTTDLARRLALSPGGVSQHLTALRAAGLVNAHRTGRVVLYARTGVGEALVAAAAA
ncbi:helix-turn-helix transcriptional regulator [Streptomyces sp. XD-27]|uniref:ArsR/SmtB family transcription factor n=1 Tax=Streptomyces sp. XD-27 TaxID=3062779 RepID=UPI0026F47613|nr:winged helix-turn-helix domain-containing protein [Streptomyces sp. XD-27]WKX70613.1 winged helix-turn-helix domain-containing protein [Streptomyces sp. XD-27]